MTYKEMQKVMRFIRKMNVQTDRKLRRLQLIPSPALRKQNLRHEQWDETERKIRALLRSAKSTHVRMLAAQPATATSAKTSSRLRNDDIDRRLERLIRLVERQKKTRPEDKRA